MVTDRSCCCCSSFSCSLPVSSSCLSIKPSLEGVDRLAKSGDGKLMLVPVSWQCVMTTAGVEEEERDRFWLPRERRWGSFFLCDIVPPIRTRFRGGERVGVRSMIGLPQEQQQKEEQPCNCSGEKIGECGAKATARIRGSRFRGPPQGRIY
jgi:hypothetical protein